MLEKRKYTRQELIDLYKTSRLDAIKNKIRRAGYLFTDTGRGSSYTLEITELPQADQFNQYCIEELGFSPQTDFQKLKTFLLFFLANEEFMTLQYNEMEQIIQDYGGSVSATTISGYFKQLSSIGWADQDPADFVYFLYDGSTGKPKYITREEYCSINKEFWQLIKKGGKTWKEAYTEIKEKYGSKPRKRPRAVKIAFAARQYEELWDLIDTDLKENKMEG